MAPRLLLIAFFSIFLCLSGSCQKLRCLDKEFSGDCDSALFLRASGRRLFTTSPEGHGRKLEISGNPANSKSYFPKEKNSAWFKLKTVTSGELSFLIRPIDIKADFDFLLFRDNGPNTCKEILSKQRKPVRTNISRNDTSTLSITGLGMRAREEFSKSGIGDQISRSIEVQKGDSFYLVLNNDNGVSTPFDILFKYYTYTQISGQVLSESENNPLKGAEVSWEELSGEELARGVTDEEGKFEMNVPIRKSVRPRPYLLIVSKEGHLYEERKILASSVDTVLPISVVLPELIKGNRMTIRNINFMGGSPVPIKSAYTSMRRLLKLMKKNPSLEIKIEGHTNGCPGGILSAQNLSEARAKRIKGYLVKNKIREDRIKTQGFNCSEMLYPNPETPEEMELNRRVEILVTSY